MTLQAPLECKSHLWRSSDRAPVDLPLAIEFAQAGVRVTGIDADPERVAWLTREDSSVRDVHNDDRRQLISWSTPATRGLDGTGNKIVWFC